MKVSKQQRKHSFKYETVYSLSFGNITIGTYADEYTRDKNLDRMQNLNADTASGFIEYYDSLSFVDKLAIGIEEDTILKIRNITKAVES